MAISQSQMPIDDRSLAVAMAQRAVAELPTEAVHRIVDYIEAWHRVTSTEDRAETYAAMLADAFGAVRAHHDATPNPTKADILLWRSVLTTDSVRPTVVP